MTINDSKQSLGARTLCGSRDVPPVAMRLGASAAAALALAGLAAAAARSREYVPPRAEYSWHYSRRGAGAAGAVVAVGVDEDLDALQWGGQFSVVIVDECAMCGLTCMVSGGVERRLYVSFGGNSEESCLCRGPLLCACPPGAPMLRTNSVSSDRLGLLPA